MAPRANRKFNRRRGRRAPARKPMRRMRKSRNSVEYAEAKQTVSLDPDQFNQIYNLNEVMLASYDRLVNIAQAYQFFKITKIEYKFKPQYDTFTSTYGQNTVPYLYWLIDKGEVVNPTGTGFDALRDAGAKPIRFDDKTITVRWAPAVANYAQQFDPLGAQSGQPNQYRISPWLTTNENAGDFGTLWKPSRIAHKGLLYGVEQFVTGGVEFQYKCDITVHMRFKKPLNLPGLTEGMTPAIKKTVGPAPIIPKEPVVESA